MKNFRIEDFEGAGHYLVKICPTQNKQREDNKSFHLSDTGFLSTIMYKIGYQHGNRLGTPSTSCMIAMSDGWVRMGHFDKHESNNVDDWEFIPWINKQIFCDYLNDPFTEEYRFATIEEVIRVVLHQRNYRTKEC